MLVDPPRAPSKADRPVFPAFLCTQRPTHFAYDVDARVRRQCEEAGDQAEHRDEAGDVHGTDPPLVRARLTVDGHVSQNDRGTHDEPQEWLKSLPQILEAPPVLRL